LLEEEKPDEITLAFYFRKFSVAKIGVDCIIMIYELIEYRRKLND
jgi:hypothetical protein